MRWLLFSLFLLVFRPCLADEADEQIISTEDKKCAIHYLSAKTRKLWSIEVDKSYCHNGWVQGFATVILKDSLNRPARTLKGFFQQGYWLSDFPGPIDTFYRFTPQKNTQDFIFESGTDKKDNAVFYTVATSIQKENLYPPFNLCPQNPLLLVVHEPVTDFDQSLFQTNILNQAQDLLKKKCPTVKAFNLIGGTSQILTEEDGPFRATINMATGETTLSFISPIPLKEKLHPTELRREDADHLITIHPEPQPENLPTNQTSEEPPQTLDNQLVLETNLDQQLQSAVDLVLMTHVFQVPVQGKSILYIDTTSALQATHPLPLILQSNQPIGTGWHIVMGVFNAQDDNTKVDILWAKPCLKEWCTDEN